MRAVHNARAGGAPLAPAKRGTGSGIASNRVPAFWTRGVCPCYDHLAQVAACDACYQVVSAQNGQKRGPRTMATDKSPSPRLGRGLVVAMAEFPTAFRPHTITGQNVQKRRLPGSGMRVDRVEGFLDFFYDAAEICAPDRPFIFDSGGFCRARAKSWDGSVSERRRGCVPGFHCREFLDENSRKSGWHGARLRNVL
jgi:hypothetical protein